MYVRLFRITGTGMRSVNQYTRDKWKEFRVLQYYIESNEMGHDSFQLYDNQGEGGSTVPVVPVPVVDANDSVVKITTSLNVLFRFC